MAIILKNNKNIKQFNNKTLKGLYKNYPKILKFNNVSQSLLTEKDIINLFMGFIKLIKKSVANETDVKYKNIINNLKEQNYKLKSMLDQCNKDKSNF